MFAPPLQQPPTLSLAEVWVLLHAAWLQSGGPEATRKASHACPVLSYSQCVLLRTHECGKFSPSLSCNEDRFLLASTPDLGQVMSKKKIISSDMNHNLSWTPQFILKVLICSHRDGCQKKAMSRILHTKKPQADDLRSTIMTEVSELSSSE